MRDYNMYADARKASQHLKRWRRARRKILKWPERFRNNLAVVIDSPAHRAMSPVAAGRRKRAGSGASGMHIILHIDIIIDP
jgi:hypothetical protein